MLDARAAFCDAIRAAGLHPPETIEADGELHRYSPTGKRGDETSWYVFHGDGVPAGAFGDWRAGISETWRSTTQNLSTLERTERRAEIEAARLRRQAAEVQRQAQAAVRAAGIWERAKPAPDSHPYLLRKGVEPHGLRVYSLALAVPMRDSVGTLHSLQFVGPGGEKRFLSGGRVAGTYFGIGAAPEDAQTLCIAEGFATAASVHESTGCPVAAALSAGNLEPVARALRTKYPGARLIVAADNDASGVGQRKAAEAARAVRGAVALPARFGDFNDLGRARGPAEVRRMIEAVV